MCGIAGIYNFQSKNPVNWNLLNSMCKVIAHRGPNDQGIFIDGEIGLGMRRLSIIDLETGRQPVHNEDRTIWTVFNGEIYNFVELRKTLTSLGHEFYTKTDTEVIVHAYEEYGEDCVEYFRGMFAFAVWDSRNNKLFIARDRFGIKPLHYAICNGSLIFGSELKSLLQHPALYPEINYQSLNHYLSYLYTPAQETILKGVYKLPPGHTLICHKGKIQLRQYWDIRPEPDYSLTENAVVEKLRYLIRKAVNYRLVSDVPIGAFLSGGLDSSTIVANMTELLDRPVKTFSVGFPEADFNEAVYARTVAKALGTEHYELEVTPDSLSIVEDLVWFLDEPMGDSSAIPTYLVSKLASQHVTVALSGDGGDEMFAGYDHYLRYQSESIVDKVPQALRKHLFNFIMDLMPTHMRGKNLLQHLSLSHADRFANGSKFFQKSHIYQLLTHDAYQQVMAETTTPLFPVEYHKLLEHHSLANILYVDLKRYLPLDILTKVDRMSMSHSLEVRVPFLDHELAKFIATIPTELKLCRKNPKYILKKTMRHHLPEDIINRKKQGFAIPLKHWFKNEWKHFLLDNLLNETARTRGIIQQEYIVKLYNEHCAGKDHSLQLWMLLVFELWCRKFLDKNSASNFTCEPAYLESHENVVNYNNPANIT